MDAKEVTIIYKELKNEITTKNNLINRWANEADRQFLKYE